VKTVEELNRYMDNTVNVLISAHNGRVDVVGREDSTVYVTMSGGCHGCAGAKHTLGLIVSKAIVGFDPSVTEVVDTTDHDSGESPYFSKLSKNNGES
jgi:Fe-S cluster biogenesis protein NfuA